MLGFRTVPIGTIDGPNQPFIGDVDAATTLSVPAPCRGYESSEQTLVGNADNQALGPWWLV